MAATKWVSATMCVLFGIVLLVARKIAAGTAFVCSALMMTLPPGRLVRRARLLLWVRVVSVTALLVLAMSSIAHTDIRPDQRVTGYAFVDKLASLLDDFRQTVLGGGDPAEQGGGPEEITREMADEFARCLRDHGLSDLPDPKLTEDGLTVEFGRVNEPQEVIRAAQDACRHIVRDGRQPG